MTLLLGLLVLLVAISFFVWGNLNALAERNRTLQAIPGSPRRIGWFGLDRWMSNRQKPRTLFLLVAFVCGLAGFIFSHALLGFALGAAVGYLLPRILYGRRMRARLRKLDEQFAPSLVLVANGMRAGQTLVQAFDVAAGSLKEPIAGEFMSISRQIRLGMPIEDALVSFAKRVPLPESTILVKAMQISIQTGADLPAAIGQIAATIASRAKLDRKVKTLTAQGKAQGLIIGATPLVLGIGFSIMNPQYFKTMIGTFWGNLIIVTVLVLQTVGFLFVRRITNVPL
jgi:tight adherence protein B